jgi:hypothetical protein
MKKIISLLIIVIVQFEYATAQLDLSPVNTGDCVAARIQSKRTPYMDEYYKKYCAQNKDKKLERQCLENTKWHKEFSFFTDRCSEKEYNIGINGKEIALKRVSKKPGRPTNFIGSFTGNGIRVVINNPRLVAKEYFEDEPKTEDNVSGGVYKVDVIVVKGKITKTFKNMVLLYGL